MVIGKQDALVDATVAVDATYEEPNLPAVANAPKPRDPDCPADSFIMAAALQMMASQTPDKRVRARCMELIKYFKGPA
jgi:hypothetical protein